MKNRRYIVCLISVIVVGLVFFGRLINWQVVNGEEYKEIANNADSYKESLVAARGEIYDTNGVGLAINSAGYSIQLNKMYLKDGTENEIIRCLIEIFAKHDDDFVDKLPITLEAGKYEFSSKNEYELKQLKNTYNIAESASAKECISALAEKFDCKDYTKQMQRDIISVRYNMEKEGFNERTPYIFAVSVNQTTIEAVSENSAVLSCVQIKTTPQRQYVNGEIAPHIIGTIGAINKEEYEKLKESGEYALNSKIGKTGIESAFEKNLKGKDGTVRISSTQDGTTLTQQIVKEAQNGDRIYLTIDSKLQAAALETLKENCAEAQNQAKKDEVVTASIVVLDVKDFSVLCAQSYPSFDLSRYYEDKKYYNEIVTDVDNNPLFSRCFEGCYAIGSTMKPAVAIAALEEGIIDANTQFYCNHTYTRFSPNYSPKCLGRHGNVKLKEALAESCNIFFFETAYKLGVSKMNQYQSDLGLGQKTGIEINEKAGILAGPEEREERGGTWYDGDTITAAIGQSDNLITPIQLATYCATIANSGVRCKTHLIKKITDSTGNITKVENSRENPTIVKDMKISKDTIDEIKTGMRAVVTQAGGTARNTLGNYGVKIAAKTGTAQVTSNKSSSVATDTSTLIAFAPYDDPKVAVGIVMEYTKTGVFAANVLKDVLNVYFEQNA